MKTKTYNVYRFDELSKESQEKAIQNLCDINVDHNWWFMVYEDAKQVFLEIASFDIDRRTIEVYPLKNHSILDVAHAIEKNHGESCETFKTTKDFLRDRDEIIDSCERDEYGEPVSYSDLDEKLDACEREYLRALGEDYLQILRNEYEYLTSKESIIETLEVYDYAFTEDGKLD